MSLPAETGDREFDMNTLRLIVLYGRGNDRIDASEKLEAMKVAEAEVANRRKFAKIVEKHTGV